ncbi:MAG: DUF420 domain-containing protein [Pirellulales bacterium]|nr:DUF420 domain-containing protein [Pirellulales bacterium]
MEPDVLDRLPELNALLNAAATAALVTGYILIRAGRETAHRRVMLTAFCLSVLFLASYLVHHYHIGGSKPYQGEGLGRTLYRTMLFTHAALAALVPPLAVATIILGWRDRRAAHRRLARLTLPIWLYVSVTGVIIYFVLYVFDG